MYILKLCDVMLSSMKKNKIHCGNDVMRTLNLKLLLLAYRTLSEMAR